MLSQSIVVYLLFVLSANALVHEIQIDNDSRLNFFISNFGYNSNGHIEINFHRFVVPEPDSSISNFGLIIKISNSDHSQDLSVQKGGVCPLVGKLAEDEIVVPIPPRNQKGESFLWELDVPKAGLYNLFFVNCKGVPVSFKMTLTQYNMIDGKKNFLPAGDQYLTLIYSLFAGTYLIVTILWLCVLRGKVGTLVNKVHYLMTVLILLKLLAIAARAIENHFLSLTGKAEGWNVPYYIFAFSKGVMMFVVIGIIGSGYTFFKYYLSDRDRKIIIVVIPLQIIANIAQIEALEGSLGSIAWRVWSTVFQVLDIICCIAVIFPVALTIRHLKDAAATDGKAARNVEKLQRFRQFYLIVVLYLYFTRIIIVFTSLTLPFTVDWINVVLDEVASLAFFIYVGYTFRPKADSPYFEAQQEDPERIDDTPPEPTIGLR